MRLTYSPYRRERIRTACKTVAEGQFPPQRQDSLEDQVGDLYALALKCGLHDAAHWLREILDSNPNVV